MKRILHSILLAAVVFPTGAYAGSRIDLFSQSRLRDARLSVGHLAEVASGRKCAPSAPGTVNVLLALDSGFSVADLEAEGLSVAALRGSVALCTVPLSEVERIASLDGVRKLEVDAPRRPMTRGARAASGVDLIHRASGLPQPFTGRGVICGIYDQGVDPNHVNFRDGDGFSRIFSLAHLRANSVGYPVFSYFDRSNLHLFATDEPSTYHGTHTLGIMAGSYRGPLDAGYDPDMDSSAPNPFYGMAPEADIMVTCGLTSDFFIANGVNQIVEYAVENNRPAVINLSLGGNIGTHDGNSIMSQFLEAAGEDCIIVVAAGNDGDVPLHAQKTFAEGDTEFKTLIKAYYEPELNGYLRYGQTAIYSADSSVMDVQAVVLNRKTGRIAYRIPLPAPGSGTANYHITDIEYQVSDEDIVSQPLSKYFNGYLGIGSAMDEDTGKFYCMLDYYLTNDPERNADDSYVPGLIISGQPGQTARMWTDGMYTCFDSFGFEGWSDGTTDGTISDMATARNIVVVGSYNTDGTLHYIDGTSAPFQPQIGEFHAGDVTSFSAYGTLEDGRSLPHVCAPGVSLISSTSRFFVEDELNGVKESEMSAKVEVDGVVNWWSQTGGTSMAAPVVAGSIALWLEANPDLTVDEVIDIIRTTAVVDEDVRNAAEPGRWGAGKFDAYAGLQEVIRRSGVNSIEGEGSHLMLTHDGGRVYRVVLPGAVSLSIEVFAADGRCVKSADIAGEAYSLDLSSLVQGIYMVRVNSSASAKLMVK